MTVLNPKRQTSNPKLVFRFLFLLSSVICHLSSQSQQFGGTPASIHWRQVNTDTVRVIFPEGFEEKAKRIASVVHYLQQNYSRTIGTSLRKINIVVQDQGLVSNGYVGLGPYRSEFYVTPPQDPFNWVPLAGAICWLCMSSGMCSNTAILIRASQDLHPLFLEKRRSPGQRGRHS